MTLFTRILLLFSLLLLAGDIHATKPTKAANTTNVANSTIVANATKFADNANVVEMDKQKADTYSHENDCLQTNFAFTQTESERIYPSKNDCLTSSNSQAIQAIKAYQITSYSTYQNTCFTNIKCRQIIKL